MRIARIILILLTCVVAGGLGAASVTPSETAVVSSHDKDPNHHADDNDDATMNHRFDDVAQWVARFDDPARDEWQKPAEVVAALKLSPGMIVADIGAGTGYFNRYLAAAVGPGGKVVASDIEPAMVKHMKERAIKEKTPNVVPLLAAPDNPKLPEGKVDVVLICDTYHHISDRLSYFERLKKSLRPGGRLAIVDFKPGDLPVGPPPEHKLAPDFVTGELTKIGWRVTEQPEILPYQYFLILVKD